MESGGCHLGVDKASLDQFGLEKRSFDPLRLEKCNLNSMGAPSFENKQQESEIKSNLAHSGQK